jgi:hypothetical protein
MSNVSEKKRMYTFSCWIICENSSISEIFIFKIDRSCQRGDY